MLTYGNKAKECNYVVEVVVDVTLRITFKF